MAASLAPAGGVQAKASLPPAGASGLIVVYSIVSASWSGGGVAASADGNYSDFAGQAGLRYFIKDNLALQGQIGFGYGTLGLGATWKF